MFDDGSRANADSGAAFLFNPPGTTRLTLGMEVVTMGETSRVQQLMLRIGDGSAPVFAGEEPVSEQGDPAAS